MNNAVRIPTRKNNTPKPTVINFANTPTLDAIIKDMQDGIREEISEQFKSKKVKPLSLSELVDYVMKRPKKFPFGMDTQIVCADRKGEGVYQEAALGLMTMDDDGYANAVVIGYDKDKSMV